MSKLRKANWDLEFYQRDARLQATCDHEPCFKRTRSVIRDIRLAKTVSRIATRRAGRKEITEAIADLV